jgi:Polysaccharide lyase/RTX calcium-binding nonapeptide repeat (4 copies)
LLSTEFNNSTPISLALDPLTPKNLLDAALVNPPANNPLRPLTDGEIKRLVKGGSGTPASTSAGINNQIVGDETANLLRGSNRQDFIYGRGGADRLLGNRGSDVMAGQSGNDVLAGGSGNDILKGGAGKDTLIGNSGRDRFVLANTPVKTKISSADVIRDFTDGQDTIRLSGGLTFAQLRIVQGKDKNAQDTLLQDTRTGKYVAVLKGVNSQLISQADFGLASSTPAPAPVQGSPTPPIAIATPTPIANAMSTPTPTLGVTSTTKPSSKLLFVDDFESGGIDQWSPERPTPQAVRVVPSPLGDGKAVRFELNRGDRLVHGGKRAELALDKIPANSERWYGYRIMLPTSWEADASQEIVTQWHEYPDFDLGEDWRSPPLALTIRNDKWAIDNRWDPKRVTKNNDPRPEGGIASLWSGPYQKGVWTDWVVRAKWSSKSDGLLQIWKDGVMVVNKRGANTYNDRYAPYFKAGIYKPSWKINPQASNVDQRVLYFDRMRIGDGSASYNDVSR